MTGKTKAALALLLGCVVFWFLFLRPAPINNWPITNRNSSGTDIIAFGDSLTHGYNVSRDATYPAQLSRLIGQPVLNKGVNGDTTEDGLQRLDRDVLFHDPRVVLVCLGGNDILANWDMDRTFRNLREMIDRIQASGAMVVLIGVDGDGFFRSGNYNERFRELAKETGCVYVPDFLKGLYGRSDFMVDQIHPNAAGYEKFVGRLVETAGEYLEG